MPFCLFHSLWIRSGTPFSSLTSQQVCIWSLHRNWSRYTMWFVADCTKGTSHSLLRLLLFGWFCHGDTAAGGSQSQGVASMWRIGCALTGGFWNGLNLKPSLICCIAFACRSWSKCLGFWVTFGTWWSIRIVHHESLKENTLFLWELIGDHIIPSISRQLFQQITDLHQQLGLLSLRFCWRSCGPWRFTWSLARRSCWLLLRHLLFCLRLCFAACGRMSRFLFSLPLFSFWIWCMWWMWRMWCWSSLACS